MEYAIIVGIDHYDKRALSGAVADAEAFAKFLTDMHLVSNPDNIKLLKSDASNQIVIGYEIDNAIEAITENAKTYRNETNRIYFYFSGHGIGNTFNNTALCMRFWPKMINHCISSLDYLTGLINKGIFDEVLLFLDCCRENDTMIKGLPPIGDWQNKVGERVPKVLVCNSTIYGKLSYEVSIDSNQKRGAFTSFLIESLKGDADINNSGRITALDLKQHIENNFPTYALKYNKIQNGSASTDNGGDNIVICEVKKLEEAYNFEITFNRNSNVTLYNKNADKLRTDNVVTGDKWHYKLEKGNYVLLDNISGEQKTIINFSENTVGYEQF